MSDRLTSAQIRGARGMLDWSMLELAKAAGVSVSSVKRVEDEKLPTISDGTFRLLREAFEVAGVRFMACDGGKPGLYLSAPCEPAAPA